LTFGFEPGVFEPHAAGWTDPGSSGTLGRGMTCAYRIAFPTKTTALAGGRSAMRAQVAATNLDPRGGS
jgi:hypothetical protein